MCRRFVSGAESAHSVLGVIWGFAIAVVAGFSGIPGQGCRLLWSQPEVQSVMAAGSRLSVKVLL